MPFHLWGRDCRQEFNISMEKQLCGNFRYRVDYIYKDTSKFAISSSITETSKKLKKKKRIERMGSRQQQQTWKLESEEW